MSGVRAGALVLAGRLLHYPGPGYVEDLRAFKELVGQLGLDTACGLQTCIASLEGRSVGELQELFTQTFDMTPTCALEVGWHLFGEEYARGAFLVDMRTELRRHNVEEGTELPDHLASLLKLVTRVEAQEARALVEKALLPAVVKMVESLEKADSPFTTPMHAIRQVLGAYVPAQAEVSHV